MSEIIQLTETARLRVEHDDSPQCPRGDWDMLTGFVSIDGRGDERRSDVPAVHEAPIPIIEALDRYENTAYHDPSAHEGRGGWRYPLAGSEEEMVVRWARIFHGLHLEHDFEHGGFWFVAGADAATYVTEVDAYSRCLFHDNWPDIEPGSPESLEKQAEVIEQERETYRQWADGEVYGVILERATAMAPVVRNEAAGVWDLRTPLTDDEIELSWNEEESIWDSYLDDDYTAKAVALEHFELTDQEKEALA